MPTMLSCVAVTFATALVPLPAQSVTWKGAEVEIDALAEERPAAAAMVAAWAPFVADVGYRCLLDDAARVLLVLNDRHARAARRSERPAVEAMLTSLAETVAATDALLGAADPSLPPAVLVGVRDDDYAKLLAHVATIDPRLAAWTKGRGRADTGFVLSEPLVATWLDDATGQEEWDRNNEVVHRAAQLLLRSRAPQTPPWFALGFGWHVEEQVRGTIYCFPHRSGFVWAAEHGDWDQRLAAEFAPARRKKADLPPELTIAEFADWDPMADGPEFDTFRACVSFGVVRYLATRHAASFAAIATAFDEAIREGWVVRISDTEWTTDPTFRLQAERQLEILRRVDPEILASITQAFAKRALERPGRGRRAPR